MTSAVVALQGGRCQGGECGYQDGWVGCGYQGGRYCIKASCAVLYLCQQYCTVPSLA